jgi:hypothetical protein
MPRLKNAEDIRKSESRLCLDRFPSKDHAVQTWFLPTLSANTRVG